MNLVSPMIPKAPKVPSFSDIDIVMSDPTIDDIEDFNNELSYRMGSLCDTEVPVTSVASVKRVSSTKKSTSKKSSSKKSSSKKCKSHNDEETSVRGFIMW